MRAVVGLSLLSLLAAAPALERALRLPTLHGQAAALQYRGPIHRLLFGTGRHRCYSGCGATEASVGAEGAAGEAGGEV